MTESKKTRVKFVIGKSAKTPSGKPKPSGFYMPNSKDRHDVREMSAYGIPQERIASILGIATNTLRRHFSKELEEALQDKNLSVAKALYRNAVKHKNVVAQIFWLKAQAGWRSEIAVPPQAPALPTFDQSKLTTDELQKLEKLLRKCTTTTVIPAIAGAVDE